MGELAQAGCKQAAKIKTGEQPAGRMSKIRMLVCVDSARHCATAVILPRERSGAGSVVGSTGRVAGPRSCGQ